MHLWIPIAIFCYTFLLSSCAFCCDTYMSRLGLTKIEKVPPYLVLVSLSLVTCRCIWHRQWAAIKNLSAMRWYACSPSLSNYYYSTTSDYVCVTTAGGYFNMKTFLRAVRHIPCHPAELPRAQHEKTGPNEWVTVDVTTPSQWHLDTNSAGSARPAPEDEPRDISQVHCGQRRVSYYDNYHDYYHFEQTLWTDGNAHHIHYRIFVVFLLKEQ